MPGLVTLLTDFGTRDSYVAEVKAVLLSGDPRVGLVDLTHEVRPFDISLGAFQLLRAYRHFPKGTYHLAVVDPGVGSRRKCLFVETARYRFIGPDNGLLKWAVRACEKQEGRAAKVFEIPVGESAGPTFHGRDVFAPALVRHLRGKPGRLKRLESMEGREFPEPRERGGKLVGEILAIDHFGNLVTSFAQQPGETPEARIGLRTVLRTVGCYADIPPGEACLVPGSHGFWEISCRSASAHEKLALAVGQEITILR
jgi:S-adenosyl-L-methionine hydrolase (adenosine-forming)